MDNIEETQTKKPLLNAAWYVIHTYSGHEQKVKINLEKRLKFFKLQEQVEEIFIPTEQKIEVKEGKRREVTKHLYPGYVFIKTVLNDEIFSVVKGTPGVTAFVGTATKAVPLSDKQVEAIRTYSEQDTAHFETQFNIGEGIKITDGPFADFVGTVDEIDQERGKIKVLVSIFGRETPVELDFLQVGKL